MVEKILNNDRIYEGYKGDLGKEFQLKVQKRFLWMSQMVHGKSILDVGCSQGIFPILMAREGKRVVGVDLDRSAIEKANNLKSQEENSVQKNVDFISVSMNDLEINEKFDTIILSEILEHVFYPADMLKKATSMLNDDGVIVITVPFGINSYFDHKKTYYVFDLFKETNGILKITDMEFFDTWIGIKCIKSDEITETMPLQYLEKMEKNLYEMENKLFLKYTKITQSLSESKNENKELEKTIENEKKLVKEKENIIEGQQELIEEKIKLIEEQKNEISNMIELLKQEKEKSNLLYEEKTKLEENALVLNNTIQILKKDKTNKMKQINALTKEINGFNRRKIIRLLRKIKNIKGYIFRKREKKIRTKEVKKINMDFYNNIDSLIKNIPESNGSNYYKKSNIRIGVITDEFMYDHYKNAVDLVYVDYNNYKEIIDSVDLLLYITTWHGMKGDDWLSPAREDSYNRIIEVFDYAKKQNKKVIFQSKEDPSNYHIFICVAKHADYIFTTAAEKIPDYKKDTGNDNVYLLEYGINILICNPIGFRNNKIKDAVFFAGSWAPRYKERCDDAQILLDGIIDSSKKLILADRNYNRKGFDFPEKYQEYIIPSIEHQKLQKTHKLFDWSINLNSIKYSPTMCAMRGYELQAIGNLMLSNYSLSVSSRFPNIFTVKTPEEVSKILNSYNEVEIYKMQVDGIRNVMSHHTVYDKLNRVFECINEKQYIIPNKKVLVVCGKITDKIKKEFNNQTYKEKNLIEKKMLNKNIIKDYDYIAYVGESYNYKKYYLEDLINAFKYTDSDYVCINSKIEDNKILGINHDYVTECNDIELCVMDVKRCDALEIINKKSIKGKGYSIDPFQISKVSYKMKGNAKISVIIPVFNNGKYLMYTCFNSLLRSSMFNKMEIIIVDDGSDDKETIDIINELKEKYPNVKTYFLKNKGDGNAERTISKGVELSTTKYVTYLYPESEAINDGYTDLYNMIEKKHADFSFGNSIELGFEEKTEKYYDESKVIYNPEEELKKIGFKTNNIQACIIRKQIIMNKPFSGNIDSAGQFYELMKKAKKCCYVDKPTHIYYSERQNLKQ